MTIEIGKSYSLVDGLTANDFFEQTEKREFAFHLLESDSFTCVNINNASSPERIADVVFASSPGIEYSLPEEFWYYFAALPVAVTSEVTIPLPIPKAKSIPSVKVADECSPILHKIEAGEIRVLDDVSVVADPRDPKKLIEFISSYLLCPSPSYSVVGTRREARVDAIWDLFELHQRQVAVQKLCRLVKRENVLIDEQLATLKSKYAG